MIHALWKASVAVLFAVLFFSLRAPKVPAAVNLSVLVAAAPFRDALAQYDQEIATLRYVHASTAPDAGKALENDRNALLHETDQAQARIRAINDRRLNSLQKQELAINLAGDLRLHAPSARADNDFAHYRDDLASQEQNVMRKYKLLLDSGMQRAYAAQAQMLRERESLLVFNLAQKESGVRLQTHARLQNIAPDRDERARLQSTLQTLDRQDIVTVREQRERDDVLLQSNRARLIAQTRAAYERMQGHIKKTDAANLAQRRRIADVQMHNAAFPSIPNGAAIMSSLPKKLQEFAASDQSNRRGRKTLDAFDHTRNVLTTRFALLSMIDARAKNTTNAQIAQLIHERLDLRNEIDAFIIRNAQKIADQQNLGKVFPSNQAPRESIDITAEVKNNLKASL